MRSSAVTERPRRRRPHQRISALDHHPGALADMSGYSPDLNMAQKIQLLEPGWRCGCSRNA